VLVLTHAGRLSHRADRELEQIRREEPGAGRLAPQHHTAGRLTRPPIALGRDQHHELVEIDRAQCRAAVPHLAELDDGVHLRRRDPGDVGRRRRFDQGRLGWQAVQ